MSLFGPYLGLEARLYYVSEVTYGVTPTNPVMKGYGLIESVDPEIDPGLIQIMAIGKHGPTHIKAGLRQPMLKANFGIPFEAPYDLITGGPSIASKTIEVIYEPHDRVGGIIDLLYTGCKVQKSTVECHVEDFIKGSIEFWAQNLAVGTSKISGATYPDNQYYRAPILFHQSFVDKGDAGGGNYVNIERVTDWKYECNNNLKRVPVIRSTSGNLLKYLMDRQFTLSGELTLEFESKDEFDQLLADAEFSLRFGFAQASGQNVVLKYCKWDYVSAPVKAEDLISCTARFVGQEATAA